MDREESLCLLLRRAADALAPIDDELSYKLCLLADSVVLSEEASEYAERILCLALGE